MKKVFAVLITVSALICTATLAQEKKSPSQNGKAPSMGDPTIFLIRDRAVQKDLALRDDQKKSIRKLLDELDGPLFGLRDVSPEQGGEARRKLDETLHGKLKGMLSSTQLKRLDQLVCQADGVEAFLVPDIAQKLGLTSDQKKQIQQGIDETIEAVVALQQATTAAKVKEIAEKTANLRAEGRARVFDVLSDDQKKQWSAMLGKSFDVTKVAVPGPIKAPELVDANEWINAESLSLQKLRGKVVALHFWTFG